MADQVALPQRNHITETAAVLDRAARHPFIGIATFFKQTALEK